jgi:hypothetical protein
MRVDALYKLYMHLKATLIVTYHDLIFTLFDNIRHWTGSYTKGGLNQTF